MLKDRFSVGSGKRGKPVIYLTVAVILLLLPLFIRSSFYLHVFIMTFIFIIVTSSLRLISTSGQISIGHAGFMSIGAYTSGIIAKDVGLSPWLSIIIGAVFTMIIGFLVGITTARVRGIYFSMVTLFFGATILAVNQIFSKYTGGYSGIGNIPPLFKTGSKLPYYYCFLMITIVSLLILYRLEFSRIGKNWKAVAQSHSIASSIGINEARQRALALAIGCLFVGLAGATYAHYFLVLTQNAFGFLVSLNLMVYMLVGGIASFNGPIVGTAILVIIPQVFRNLKDYVPYITAGILLIVLFIMPKGLTGLPEQVRIWIRARKEKSLAVKEEVNDSNS